MNAWILGQVPSPTTGPGGATAPVAPVEGGGGAPVAITGAAGSQAATATQAKAQEPPAGNNYFIFIMGGIILVGYFFMTRGPKKEEKKRKAMLESMKKGDEVETIGGLIGKVVDVKDDRVVIKVDESTNVKETYRKAAILRVVTQDDKPEEKK